MANVSFPANLYTHINFVTNTTTPTSSIQWRSARCRNHFVVWYHVPLLVIGILIICINLPIPFFVKTSRILKRNAGNFILIGLSLVDLLTGFHAVYHVIPIFYFMAVDACDNNLFRAYNNAGFLLGKICLLGSIGHLLLLAGERMIRLFRPFHYKTMIVCKKVVPFLSSVWMVSICLPLIELAYRNTKDEMFFRKIHVTVTIIGFWFFPLLLLFAQYLAMLVLIYKFQQKHSVDMKSMFLRYKAFFIYLAMFVSFLVLSSPHFCIRIVIAFFPERFVGISHDMLRVVTLLRYLPSLTNPFLYGVLKEDFQKALWRRRARFSSTLKSESDLLVQSRLSTRRHNDNNNAMNATSASAYQETTFDAGTPSPVIKLHHNDHHHKHVEVVQNDTLASTWNSVDRLLDTIWKRI